MRCQLTFLPQQYFAAILPKLMILTSVEYTPLISQLSKQELIEHFKSAQN